MLDTNISSSLEKPPDQVASNWSGDSLYPAVQSTAEEAAARWAAAFAAVQSTAAEGQNQSAFSMPRLKPLLILDLAPIKQLILLRPDGEHSS